MKQKGLWAFIIIILTITAVNVYGFISAKQVAMDYRKESANKDQTIAQLKQQRKFDKAAYELDIQKVQEQAKDTDIIYGYIIGYLNATDRSLITNEIPEFAVLTVQYANESGVSPFDCITICQIENGFDLHKPGSKGEQGPAQLMAATWAEYYKKFNYHPADFYKWQCNYRVAIAHFSELLKQHNDDIAASIGEYNGGGKWAYISSSRNHVQKFIIANRGISRLKKERVN